MRVEESSRQDGGKSHGVRGARTGKGKGDELSKRAGWGGGECDVEHSAGVISALEPCSVALQWRCMADPVKACASFYLPLSLLLPPTLAKSRRPFLSRARTTSAAAPSAGTADADECQRAAGSDGVRLL